MDHESSTPVTQLQSTVEATAANPSPSTAPNRLTAEARSLLATAWLRIRRSKIAFVEPRISRIMDLSARLWNKEPGRNCSGIPGIPTRKLSCPPCPCRIPGQPASSKGFVSGEICRPRQTHPAVASSAPAVRCSAPWARNSSNAASAKSRDQPARLPRPAITQGWNPQLSLVSNRSNIKGAIH